MKPIAIALVLAALATAGPSPLERHYADGQRLAYRMTADNDGHHYELRADGVVTRRPPPDGRFVEEYAWSNLVFDGHPVALSQPSLDLRQIVTLAPEQPSPFPNLAGVTPNLIGPLTDFLTVYVDLWLAIKLDTLRNVGDHAVRSLGVPASWADGRVVTLGEDAVDFDFTLTAVDRAAGRATLLVRHVPPDRPAVRIPDGWLRTPVRAGTQNNWVEIATRDGAIVAASGVETFDVTITIDLSDGRIETATIDNLVDARERHCQDSALTMCSEAAPRRITRRVVMTLIH